MSDMPLREGPPVLKEDEAKDSQKMVQDLITQESPQEETQVETQDHNQGNGQDIVTGEQATGQPVVQAMGQANVQDAGVEAKKKMPVSFFNRLDLSNPGYVLVDILVL